MSGGGLLLLNEKKAENLMGVLREARLELARLQEENKRLKDELKETREDHRAFLKALEGLVEHRLRLREEG